MYRMRLDGVEIPFLPESLKETGTKNNKTYSTLLGERINPGRVKLRRWSFSSILDPETCVEKSVREYQKKLKELFESDTPFELLLLRYDENGNLDLDLGIATDVIMESLEWEDKAGEPGTLYYTIKLIEYKDFAAKKVS